MRFLFRKRVNIFDLVAVTTVINFISAGQILTGIIVAIVLAAIGVICERRFQ